MSRLISLIHQRQPGCTNGGPSGPGGPSAAAPLVQAGVLLVLTLTLMEPASATGLAWWQRAGFFAAHVAPAMGVAWFASGWLFNRAGLQRWPAWWLLLLAGGLAGLVLAPWSVALELWLGVVDLDEPGLQPVPPSLAAWWSELGDELVQVPPRTALFWLVMNLWVVWRTQQQRLPLAPPPLVLTGPAQRSAAPALPCVGLLAAPGGAPESAAKSVPESVAEPVPEPVAAAPAAAGAARSPPASAAVSGEAPRGRPTEPTGPAGGLLVRLPARLGRDIVQLEAQQHYLRVVTTRGEYLLLHGLAPAVAELAREGIAGMQIHRSLWVAWSHVERLDLRPGAPAAVLRDGRRLQIGRRRLRAVAQAWQQWPGG